MSTALILFLAMLLDAALGEPRMIWSRLPHPAVLMGRAVGWADARFNDGTIRSGVFVIAGLVLAAWLIAALLVALPGGGLWALLGAAVLLAQRSLVDHVRAVAEALGLSLGDGRLVVARIVGRDTREMDGPAISRAAIESAAENLSDGVIAPAFWFLVLGLPGMAAYKMINTADSMIGYRTPRHEAFGKAAARLDDLVNWIPARLTALLFIGGAGLWGAWGAIRADAAQHRSPNAGWPEAALARVLGVALAGPRSYAGALCDFAWVNRGDDPAPGPAAIEAGVAALWRAWGLMLGLVGGLAILAIA